MNNSYYKYVFLNYYKTFVNLLYISLNKNLKIPYNLIYFIYYEFYQLFENKNLINRFLNNIDIVVVM